ncbi:hypothetical protein [Bradyrhizobium ganzhouense]|uniref:hypothetical protein n=1 Tax=Bradyrhizobium ganzhouense TaxID=1179767 RepID=UPI003CF59418
MLLALTQQAATPDAQTGTMIEIAFPTIELIVDTIIQRSPSSIRISLDFNMHFAGGLIATFHAVDEAYREHGIDLEKFLERLREPAQITLSLAETASAGLGKPERLMRLRRTIHWRPPSTNSRCAIHRGFG